MTGDRQPARESGFETIPALHYDRAIRRSRTLERVPGLIDAFAELAERVKGIADERGVRPHELDYRFSSRVTPDGVILIVGVFPKPKPRPAPIGKLDVLRHLRIPPGASRKERRLAIAAAFDAARAEKWAEFEERQRAE